MAIAFVRMHAEYDCSMDPVSAAVSAVLALVDWKKAIQSLANDAVSKSVKGVLGRVKRDERDLACRAVLLYPPTAANRDYTIRAYRAKRPGKNSLFSGDRQIIHDAEHARGQVCLHFGNCEVA